MANRYYTNFSLGLGHVVLEGPEARHLATVMRACLGDQVCLFNGDGCEYLATVTNIGKRDVTLRVDAVEKPQRELAIRLEIAAAMPKGDREEFLIEKLTELGVSQFVPLITERSVVVPKVERLRRTVIEASKQCGRNVLMQVAEVCRYDDYVKSASAAVKLMAHPHGGGTCEPFKALTGTIAFAIGPEGGFSDSEVQAAVKVGWQSVDLGPRILRIETAAIALAAYCSFKANSA